MGDPATLSKARQELEDLYAGIPDESVNLTFKDLASMQQEAHQNKSCSKDEMYDNMCKDLKQSLSSLSKSPSVDFAKSMQFQLQGGHQYRTDEDEDDRRRNTNRGLKLKSGMVQNKATTTKRMYDVDDGRSGVSGVGYPTSAYNDRGGRRPGIPHTNICTVCSHYVYIFRHRCLVCGRAYCRQCVRIGMGDMTEGRKCIECLGKRFSPRYIQRAGDIGCCCVGYRSEVKQQELKWAEKGPRRSERRYGRSMMESRSFSTIETRSKFQTPSTPSFVMNAHSPTHHHPITPF